MNKYSEYKSIIDYLHTNGNYILSSCPFCGDTEHHHHLSLDINKRIFYCFKCNAGGPLTKLADYLEVNPNVLLYEIANKLNIEISTKKQYTVKNKNQFEIKKLSLTDKAISYLKDRKVFSYIKDTSLPAYSFIKNNTEYIGFDFENVRLTRSLLNKEYKFYFYKQNIPNKLSIIDSSKWFSDVSKIETLVIVEGLFDAISSNLLIENSFSVAMLTNTIKAAPLLDIINKYSIKYIIIGLDKDVNRERIIKKIINLVLRNLSHTVALYDVEYEIGKDLNDLLVLDKKPIIKEIDLPKLYKAFCTNNNNNKVNMYA